MALQRDAFQEGAFETGALESIDAFQATAFQGATFQIGAPQTSGIPPTPTVVVLGTDGGAKRKKRQRIPGWDAIWQFDKDVAPETLRPAPEPVADTPREAAEYQDAKAQAEELAQIIIAHRREISRIRTQMKLSSNEMALQAMQAEIGRIEAHLARVKQEAEDMLLLTILM